MTTSPSFEPYFYLRQVDHPAGPWGVGCEGKILAAWLDKNVAAAIACLMNGEVSHARSLLEHLPDTMPRGSHV